MSQPPMRSLLTIEALAPAPFPPGRVARPGVLPNDIDGAGPDTRTRNSPLAPEVAIDCAFANGARLLGVPLRLNGGCL